LNSLFEEEDELREDSSGDEELYVDQPTAVIIPNELTYVEDDGEISQIFDAIPIVTDLVKEADDVIIEYTEETDETEQVPILEDAPKITGLDVSKKQGKKRRRYPETWPRNIKPKEAVHSHARKNIANCRCKCSDKLSERMQVQIHNKFNLLQTHTEQNVYLQGCVHSTLTQRRRVRGAASVRTARRTFEYKVENITICLQAFLAIHGIKRGRLTAKVQQPTKNISDGRGKHDTRPRSVTEGTMKVIHTKITHAG
jgi:hypothetical protein